MAGTDFTLRDFLDWARTKPADEAYNICIASACALGQFGDATNRPHVKQWCSPENNSGIEGLDDALGFGLKSKDHTFGALVKRLEALLPAVSDTWTKADAYLTDIEQVSA